MSCSRKDTTFCLHPVLVGLSSNGTSYVSTIDGSGGSSWPMYNKEYFASLPAILLSDLGQLEIVISEVINED